MIAWISNLTLVLALFHALWAFYSFSNQPSRNRYVTLFFGLSIFLWAFCHAAALKTQTDFGAYNWYQRVMYPAIFIPPLFWFYSKIAIDSKYKPKTYSLIILALLTLSFVVLTPTPYMMKMVRWQTWGIEFQGGWAFHLYSLYFFLLMGWGLRSLYVGMRHKRGLARARLLYLFVGGGIGSMAGFIANILLPILGNTFLARFGPLISSFGIAIFSYALVKSNVLDFKSFVRYGLAYFLLGLLVGSPAGLLIWLQTKNLGLTLIGFISPLAGFVFVKKYSANLFTLLDRMPIFRRRAEIGSMLDEASGLISSSPTLSDWSCHLGKSLHDILQLETIAIFHKDESQKSFVIGFSINKQHPYEVLCSVPEDSALLVNLKSQKIIFKELVVDKNDLIREFDFIEAEVVMGVFCFGQVQTLIVMGNKIGGSMFDELDVAVLSYLANISEIALSVLLSKKKMDVISRTWAHDLYRPFGPKGSFRKLPLLVSGNRIKPDMIKTIRKMIEDASFVEQSLHRLFVNREENNVEHKMVDIVMIYKKIESHFGAHSSINGITLVLNLSCGSCAVFADGAVIEKRVIDNLIENAVRHAPHGSRVELGGKTFDGEFVGWVRNSGEGISQEMLSKLFLPETQGEVNVGLTGLGLYSVKTAVETHGGRVWVESVPGQGATFFFTLPISDKKE